MGRNVQVSIMCIYVTTTRYSICAIIDKKRPSNNNNNNANRDYNRVVSDLDDLNLVQMAQRTGGSTDKKGRVSLNHLLGFSFPERQEAPATQHRKQKVTSYQPFNKERFINAK